MFCFIFVQFIHISNPQRNMKPYLLFVLLLLIAILLTTNIGCHGGRHTVIVTKSNDTDYLRIEYSGTILFNDNNTDLHDISPDGYFKCKDNNDKVLIETDRSGHLAYQFNRQDAEAKLTSATGKRLLLKAIQEIAKQQGSRGHS